MVLQLSEVFLLVTEFCMVLGRKEPPQRGGRALGRGSSSSCGWITLARWLVAHEVLGVGGSRCLGI